MRISSALRLWVALRKESKFGFGSVPAFVNFKQLPVIYISLQFSKSTKPRYHKNPTWTVLREISKPDSVLEHVDSSPICLSIFFFSLKQKNKL